MFLHHHLPWLFACGAALAAIRDFLIPLGQLPARGDPSLAFPGSDLSPQFAIWIRVAIQAIWKDGVWPFWNPYTHAGTPLLELPQAGALSLPVALGGLLSPEAAIQLSMAMHLLAGTVGTYWLCRMLAVARPVAAIAGAVFAMNPFLLGHFRVGHLNMIHPMCLAPACFALVWKALTGAHAWHRPALLGGALLGLQVLEGADSVLLYEAVAFALLALLIPLSADRASFARRLFVVGTLVGASAFVVAAPQLLPMRDYLPLTGRAPGLPWEFAADESSEVPRNLPGVLALLCCALGALVTLRDRSRRLGLWLALSAILGLVIAHEREVFHFLWAHVPGFNLQRLRERALSLVSIAAPPLLALGIDAFWRVWRGRLRIGLPVALCGMLLLESWIWIPPFPPLASTQREIAANSALRWVKSHLEPGQRMHIWESRDRHWGTEHVTVPLQIPVIAGYTSSEHQDYFPFDFLPGGHREFFSQSYADPARLWGMLSVANVVSSEPLNVSGLVPAARVRPCPVAICQPAKSAGTWIYRNERVLPAFFRAGSAVAIRGESRAVFEAALSILAMPEFDPHATAIVHVPPSDPWPPADLRLVLTASEARDGALTWPDAAAASALQRVLRGATVPGGRGEFARPNLNSWRLKPDAPGWWILTERDALFSGWGSPDPAAPSLYRADGVLSAVHFSSGGSELLLTYRPRRFNTGLWILGVAIGLALAWELWSALHSRNHGRPATAIGAAT